MSTLTEGTGRSEETGRPEPLVERAETASGYRPGRTLPLRVELLRQLKRRRTLVMFAILAALPFVLVVAFAIGGEPDSGGGERITLLDTATQSAANFAAVNLFVSAGFLLVIPVALFCGDTVASEAYFGPPCAICSPHPCHAPGCCGPSSSSASASAWPR